MELEFYGAADEVTGSLHRLRCAGAEILLDCGLFQGHREQSNRLNRELPSWASKANALVLSHAHLDHSGGIPTLVKRGFDGNIYCTPPTRDLCSVMLRDAAMIQEQDARYLNKRYAKTKEHEAIEPLYRVEDAHRAIGQMVSIPFHRPLPIAPGVTLCFYNSGHVLGSALVCLDLEEGNTKRRLLFTGDLGRDELPLLKPPEIVPDVDVLICESTYGDRLHPDIARMDEELASIVTKTIGRGGRVLIPTFALERAQEVLFALERLSEKGRVPEVPIYIDSPLAIAITEVYKLHAESLAPDVAQRMLERNDPFSPPGLRYVSEIEDSKVLQKSKEPSIVIAGSGMCEAGRILHHFRDGLGQSKNSVVIVGFMAQHTLGRRLVEGRHKVKVFGIERDVLADVHVLGGLSAHADQNDLKNFVAQTNNHGPLKQIALAHGEAPAKRALKNLLASQINADIILAEKGKTMPL
ncbi:MAG: MBL fold metallo-hydrolase [Myxococcales bacterium]|nr:MAG: MBL fold metallo-hydrolase [Myxococcales bacterium]